MVARYGWKSKPSPRRGFTVVAASRSETASPVVVAVHDSNQAVSLFSCALDEAMARSRHLVVLDYGETSLHDELEDESTDIGPRHRRSLRALWSNPHVRVIRQEPVASNLEKTIRYCESIDASLLVIGADHVASGDIDGRMASRVFDGQFDVLVLTEHD